MQTLNPAGCRNRARSSRGSGQYITVDTISFFTETRGTTREYIRSAESISNISADLKQLDLYTNSLCTMKVKEMTYTTRKEIQINNPLFHGHTGGKSVTCRGE